MKLTTTRRRDVARVVVPRSQLLGAPHANLALQNAELM
jgi:hypothetical protein